MLVKTRGVRVEGAVGALVGPAHLTDRQNVQRRRVKGPHEELLWSQGLYNHRLSGSGQVCHWKIPEKKPSEVENYAIY